MRVVFNCRNAVGSRLDFGSEVVTSMEHRVPWMYRHPPGVASEMLAGRPVLSTPEGGKVVVDTSLLRVWQAADGRTLGEMLEGVVVPGAVPSQIAAALACLAEGGLLWREGFPSPSEVASRSGLVRGPLVSVVIVAYDSRKWLEECLPSLEAQTYHPLEIIVVDNGSQDDALPWLAEAYPRVRVLEMSPAGSLAAAMNAGAGIARGDYLLMLNPDVRLEPDAVARMVQRAQSAENVAAIAPMLRFWWARAFLNGLGNRVGAFSWGTDNALGHLDLGQFVSWDELPSACFAAALIPRNVWDAVGPVDDGFPMYYEDSEWCYRARLLGYRVLAAPEAVVYHAFGGRVPSGDASDLSPFKLGNVAYGRYRFAFKIVGDRLYRFLRNYWLEDWANFTRLLIQWDFPSAKAYWQAWRRVWRERSLLRRARSTLQSRRVVDDAALFDLQQDMPVPFVWRGLPELTWEHIVEHYLPLIRTQRTRPMPEFDPQNRPPHLLIVSHDVVGQKMAGTGMRYLEMARALSVSLDVTLALPAPTELDVPGLNIVTYQETRPASLQVLVENSDIALVSGYMVEKFPFLETTSTRLVVDLYDPMVLENLHYYLDEPPEAQQALNRHAVDLMNRVTRLGDFFLCGNERQRDFWLGVLAANGRINPLTYGQDSSLRALVDVVGIGFPSRPPQRAGAFLRGVHPQVPEEARIVLWGGGIWNWLDPLTLVRAWPQVVARHPMSRLVFLGTRHPNPQVPVHAMVDKTIALAEEIGEKDRSIIFLEWVSYDERESLLVEADVGVALHPVHVETRYSARTRVLDYLWARLPVLITEGDVTSEWVQRYGLGRVVPENDPEAVSEALDELLSCPKETFAPAFEPLMQRFSWPQVVQPLLAYCRNGGYAPDRRERLPLAQADALGFSARAYSRMAKAVSIWRTQGTRAVLRRMWRYLQWRLAR